MNLIAKVKNRLGGSTLKADKYLSLREVLTTSNSQIDSLNVALLPAFIEDQMNDNPARASASIMELLALGALVKKSKPKAVFEIGTFRGLTAVSMALNCGEDCIVHTLDLPPDLSSKEVSELYYKGKKNNGFELMNKAGKERFVGQVLENYNGKSEIKQHFGDSKKYDFTPFYHAIDVFFVDGCHNYEMATNDTKVALQCLRKGGILIWHDYTWLSVQEAVKDLGLKNITHIKETSLAFKIIDS